MKLIKQIQKIADEITTYYPSSVGTGYYPFSEEQLVKFVSRILREDLEMAYCNFHSETEDGEPCDVVCLESLTENAYIVYSSGDDHFEKVKTAKEAAEALIKLKYRGYKVPQYAIDALIEDDKIDD